MSMNIEAGELQRRLEEGAAVVGQLRLCKSGSGVRIEGPDGDGEGPEEAPADPEAFRQWIRHTGTGQYRPLSGSRDLRSGWVLHCKDVNEAAGVVEQVYPLALRWAAQRADHRIRVMHPETALGRQSGRTRKAASLSRSGIDRAVRVLCGQCVRTPLWHGGEAPGDIPCPEPCSIFIALAKAAVEWEIAGDPPRQDEPGCAFADFAALGNPIRNRYLSREVEPSGGNS
jgi:hypothetical protein